MPLVLLHKAATFPLAKQAVDSDGLLEALV